MTPRSVDDLVRQFIFATLGLCSRIQAGLPAGAGLDPLQVIVVGSLRRLIEQQGEIRGVGYFKHGLGAMLWDARRPREIAGRVDIDLGEDIGGLSCYEFSADWINDFADSIGADQRPLAEIGKVCAKLVGEGVLSALPDPLTRAPGSISARSWGIRRPAPLAPLPGDDRARLEEARRALEFFLQDYPKAARQQRSFDWSEVEIVEDKDIFPKDRFV